MTHKLNWILLAGLICCSTSEYCAAQNIRAAETRGQTGSRQAITWDHVYGPNRIRATDRAPGGFQWLNDSELLVRSGSGWTRQDARTGTSTPLFDSARLKQALQSVDGVDVAAAGNMVAKGWQMLDSAASTAVYRHEDRLVRVSFADYSVASVSGLPGQVELMTLSPLGNGVAFVSENDLWVADFDAAAVRRLTEGATDVLRNGKADWVYFEEVYHRNWQAYRWSPDGKSLAFQQFDDSQVGQFRVIDHSAVIQNVETEKFPLAGTTNPEVRLGIVSIEGGQTEWVDTSKYPADDLLITHFNWLPDSSAVYWYAQNRIQTWLDINQAERGGDMSVTLLRDTTEAWVDNPGDLVFLSDGSFLLLSDRTGWRHLYRVSQDGGQTTAVTTGEWEVRKVHAVTEDETSVVVTGTHDSHIAESVYRVALNAAPGEVSSADENASSSENTSSGNLLRLTPDEGRHAAVVSPTGKLLIDRWSSIDQPSTVAVRDLNGQLVRTIHKPSSVNEDYRYGEVSIRSLPMADGSETEAIFVVPPDFDESQPHPVWLLTYGGPHYPGIRNSWSDRLFEHMLANLGVVVIRFDPRSASGYGAQSAWLAYRQLGVEETKDVVAICDWLAKQKWADTSRIGMSGHSYGGFFTAYAMTHSDRLCAGIAGAPVTDWANYDTIYTERFMSTPQLNADGYRAGSVVAAAGKLHGRLLLLHGMKDDNVHPANSLQLADALQQAGKQFELMVYPRYRHGIHGNHYNRLRFNFIVDALGLKSDE